jgi:hypothetical protein
LKLPFVTGTPFPFTVTVTAVESTTAPDTAMDVPFVIMPSVGCVTVNVGGVESFMTVIDWEVWFPYASVATTVIVFVPSTKLTDVEKLPLETETAVLFTVNVTAD